MSVLGFGFWLFVAHLYSPAQIGTATVLISITTLISNISLLGLDSSLVRFLPGSKNQSRDINAAMIVVALAAMLAAAIYVVIGPHLGIQLSLLESNWEKIGFIVLMAVVSLNSLTDSVFIANRRAELHTMTYTLLASVKLILPLFLIPFGSIGIFAAYIGAVFASLVLTFFLMRRTNGYKLTKPNWQLFSATRKYAVNNYIGHILSSATSQLMPIFILAALGAAQVAYFSMAWTMANFLYVIPTAIAQSLLAESSRDVQKKMLHLKNAIRILACILIPIVIIAILAAPYLLTIFGAQYSLGSSAIFQILALATFFVAINEVSNTILNIEHRSSGVVASQLSSLVSTFVSAIFLLRYGLIGVGASLLIGNVASSLSHVIFFTLGSRKNKQRAAEDAKSEESLTQAHKIALHKSFQTLLQLYNIHDFTITNLAKGGNAQTFLINSGTNSSILRIYRKNKRTVEQIKQEIAFTQFLKKRGVAVPTFIQNTDGRYFSEHSVNGTNRYYLLMRFESGNHPQHYTDSILIQMAHGQAAIHIHGSTFAQTRSDSTSAPADRLSLPDRLLRFVPKGFSHCDFDATNILVTDQKLTCILDFEGIRLVPFVSCLFFTLSRIYDLQHRKTNVEKYLAAYQEVRKLNSLEKLVIRTALAARYKKPRFLFIQI